MFQLESNSRQQGMLETTPVNVYGSSMDHGYESGPSIDHSRRSSFGIRDISLPSRRRYTMQSRLQVQRANGDGNRKTSYQYGMNAPPQSMEVDDDNLKPMPLTRRRMSVPENVFRRADFAIMRPCRIFSNEGAYEVLSAFDRHADPYHTFMKSITCYDLQPTHSSLVVFDGKTKVKAAVHALSQHGHIAAVVTNTDKYQAECVFNMGHCLTAILLVAAGNREVASKTLVEFLKEIGSGNIICSGVQNSVWEAANIISHNKISFVPIFDTIIPKPGTPLYFLTPRMILQETVLKLSDFGDAILLHVRQATLDQKKIGTWNDDVLKIGLNTTIEEAIKLMSERKMSTIPVVNDFKQIVNMLARKDIILEIMSHQGGNFHDMLKEPVKILQSLQSRLVYGRSSYTVFETVAKMMTSDKSSLPIIDEGKRILAVVSCSDILSYIQTAERTPTEDRSSSNSSTSSMPKSAK
ncbi:CBS domain-containing protein [Caenorhabditis elegans]|uniref:CBS domain-containing protein n=1 Tax=Caenorhabditis elegans TaxID=6239 RepID=H2L0K0_CAEEL|nr:CBS domain-containing protein [Caenorhabditis elegans]CCD74377.1 CBS domain-containing protein [Caenorhabditis elegans]|eukprot:NP_741725.2 AMP-Activated protein Kinase Gamma subunit [Caenorhabditis elegans]